MPNNLSLLERIARLEMRMTRLEGLVIGQHDTAEEDLDNVDFEENDDEEDYGNNLTYIEDDSPMKDYVIACTSSKKKPTIIYWNKSGWAKISPKRLTQPQAERLLKSKHMDKQPEGYSRPKIIEYDEISAGN